MRNRTRTEGDIDVGVKLKKAFALGLRVAAADGDHLLWITRLQGSRLREMGGEALVGLLPDRAGVEDDHVRLVLLRGLAETELLEHALDPLGIVGVHLTPEGRDVVPAHEPKL